VAAVTVLAAAPAASAAPRATGISANGDYGCAVLLSHGVECWGYNSNGQLGNGTTVDHHVPVHVTGIDNAIAVSAGAVHACALLSTCAVQNGAAKCWGENSNGQVDDGSTTNRLNPRQVVGLASGVVKVSAGWYSSCATLTTGEANCWATTATAIWGTTRRPSTASSR